MPIGLEHRRAQRLPSIALNWQCKICWNKTPRSGPIGPVSIGLYMYHTNRVVGKHMLKTRHDIKQLRCMSAESMKI